MIDGSSDTRFTLADVEGANATWGCNCGPAALAAICGLTLRVQHGVDIWDVNALY